MEYIEDNGTITINSILPHLLPVTLWMEQDNTYVKMGDFTSLPFSLYQLTDENQLEPGTYKIRITSENLETFEYLTIKGEGKIGRYFGNYRGSKVLTVDDLTEHFLKEIEINRENEVIEKIIESAVSIFEQEMYCHITPKKILTQPEENLTFGIDYQLEDDPYQLDTTLTSISIIRLRYVPVLSVQSVKLFSLTQTFVKDLTDWVKLDKRSGKISLFPSARSGTQTSTVFGAAGLLLSHGLPLNYDNGLQVDYTVGMKVDNLPSAYYQIIGMIATLLLLIPVSEEIRLGWNNVSFSIDGISQSISNSPGLLYGERIKEYKEFITEYIKKNRWHRGYSIGHV